MALDDIRIDDATWEGTTAERRREWEQALAELREEYEFEPSTTAPHDGLPARLLVTLHQGKVVLDGATVTGGVLEPIELPVERLTPHFTEYINICRDMGKLGENSHSPRLEALDIAKRIAHDEAAATLFTLCKPFRPDHSTCRRLFTLLVTMHFDTTRLLLPHHRLAPR